MGSRMNDLLSFLRRCLRLNTQWVRNPCLPAPHFLPGNKNTSEVDLNYRLGIAIYLRIFYRYLWVVCFVLSWIYRVQLHTTLSLYDLYSFRISVRLQSLLQSFHNLILRSPIIDQDLLVEWGLDFIRFMNQPVSFDIVYFIQPTMVESFIITNLIFDRRVKVSCLDFSFQMNWYYHFFLTYPTKLLYPL